MATNARGRRPHRWLAVLACAGLLAGCSAPAVAPEPGTTETSRTAPGTSAPAPAPATTPAAAPGTAAAPATTTAPRGGESDQGWRFERAAGPDRTIVRDEEDRVLATFTDGARTVLLDGPQRTFAEPGATTAKVTTTAWVRLAPQAWKAGAEHEGWFRDWLAKAAKDTSPDVFAIAFEYVDGAPERKDEKGRLIAGDAQFGPLLGDGVSRDDGTDFVDYLGAPYTFGDRKKPVQPDPGRYGMLDCSGYLRMVLGYRLGVPLLSDNDRGDGLPRRAWAILAKGPGVELIKDEGRAPADLSVLQPGDLLFFEIDSRDPRLDHMGMYLGVDSKGVRRFISSRSRANGPTMGDLGGDSTIGTKGMYSAGMRGARRI